MREPPDLNELVGDELSPDELGQLRKVDALLRRVPAPPDVPASLTAAVAEVPLAARRERRGRRVALALAFAAVLAAASFGIGHWAGSSFDVAYTVDMAPTARRARRRGVVQVGERDEGSGNVELLVDVSGLPELGRRLLRPLARAGRRVDGHLRLLRRRRRRDERQDDGHVTSATSTRGSSRQPTGMTPSRS